MVRLTLLPMLAAAAVARADDGPPSTAAPTTQMSPDPGPPPLDGLPVGFDTALAPPGMTEPVLMPPGMTPPLDCEGDPDWEGRPECTAAGRVTVTGGVVRGGFGHYFWIGG
jgi:hypothetical protein